MPIPQFDPMPLPAPLWLLRTLLLLTFGLHVLFMNLLLGGSSVALACRWQGRSQHAQQLASDLARILPATFAFTITLGIAPLLFLQVLYGQLLYASSIVIGVPWLSVIGLVLCAYYAVYFFSLRGERQPGGASVALAAAVGMLACVGLIYSNNFTLMLTPGRWLEAYARSSAGWNLNLAEPTLLPRYLHMVLGAFAIAGLFLAVFGMRKRTTEYGGWLLARGAMLFTLATIVNIGLGFWFLVRMPATVRTAVFGQNPGATIALALGVLLALSSIAALHLLRVPGASAGRLSLFAAAAGVLSVFTMVIVRDAVRNAYLAPQFRLDGLPVAPQWGVIVLFVVLFAAGLATLAYMLRAVAVAKPAALSAAAVKH